MNAEQFKAAAEALQAMADALKSQTESETTQPEKPIGYCMTLTTGELKVAPERMERAKNIILKLFNEFTIEAIENHAEAIINSDYSGCDILEAAEKWHDLTGNHCDPEGTLETVKEIEYYIPLYDAKELIEQLNKAGNGLLAVEEITQKLENADLVKEMLQKAIDILER